MFTQGLNYNYFISCGDGKFCRLSKKIQAL